MSSSSLHFQYLRRWQAALIDSVNTRCTFLTTEYDYCITVLQGAHKNTERRRKRARHLFGPGHPAALLQAADLPLQLQLGFLQLPDLLHQLANVLQITQAWTQRVGTIVLRLHKTKKNRRSVLSRGHAAERSQQATEDESHAASAVGKLVWISSWN